MLDAFLSDLRYAVRGLRAKPGFTLAVVLTLGLGLGANAAMFGIIDRMLFRPPPMLIDPETAHRVYVTSTFRGKERTGNVSQFAKFQDIANFTKSFSSTAGFTVNSSDLPDVTPVKDKHGVPAKLRSCHTAIVGGYVVEGHVPADVVKKLLRERPAGVVGIAVPGMPSGSPGMEGGRVDAYDVVTFDKNGETKVYASR